MCADKLVYYVKLERKTFKNKDKLNAYLSNVKTMEVWTNWLHTGKTEKFL